MAKRAANPPPQRRPHGRSAGSTPGGPSDGDDIGFPGQPPFTRGIHPTMYRSRLWTMRQYAGFGDAGDTNRRFRYLLEAGQTALSTAFDLPTQMGMDSDALHAQGEVGRVGVAIDTVADLERLFAAIPLDRVSTSMTINATASTLLAFYVVTAKRRGIDPAGLRGTLQNDLLKEFVARGTYVFPPQPSLRLVVDLIAYCQQYMPKWYPISISGYHMREAGATASQEVAFTFANALEYLRACRGRQLNMVDICRRLSFFFSVDRDFLEEVAKFRAARRLWVELLRRHFPEVGSDPRALSLRFHVQTGGSTLTAQQPHNNIVRVTLQALAAVLGGAQSLHTNSFDEALALPTEASALLALRTQQIIANESGVTDTVDPVGGSWAVEEKTAALVAESNKLIEAIDDQGGALAAIESQFMQNHIADSAYVFQQRVESKEQVLVGVNRFDTQKSVPVSLWQPRAGIGDDQVRRLNDYKKNRDARAVHSALGKLSSAAQGSANLLPPIIAATESGCTLGEISGAMERVFGRYEGS